MGHDGFKGIGFGVFKMSMFVCKIGLNSILQKWGNRTKINRTNKIKIKLVRIMVIYTFEN